MKKKIHRALLVSSALAAALTLLFTMMVFYGLFREQIVEGLKADALVLRSLHVFDDIENIHPDALAPNTENLRVTLIDSEGTVLFDSDQDFGVMENHVNRPEITEAFLTGEGGDRRQSETLDKNLFYYAVRLNNGTVLRVSREADSFLAVFETILPAVAGVIVLLLILSMFLSNYFTKSLVTPIERMAEHLSEPGTEAVYKELAPFVATIRRQHDDIIKSARMRQEFTANVSHELKTPLTAISGYAELIEHGMAGKENISRFAGEIHKSAARLLTLINDIIQLSRLDEGNQEAEYVDLDLYKMAEECVSMLNMNARKQNVTMKICGKSAMVRADRQLMEELFYNLCDNAIRYNNRGGAVTVTVDTGADGHVFLSVKDTGIGIPIEHQDRIFERFYRVDKSRSKATGGTGLGLAIVKHIVSRHGAELFLESEPGRGTEIRVVFGDAAIACEAMSLI